MGRVKRSPAKPAEIIAPLGNWPCCRSPGDSVATEPTVISADQNALQDLNAIWPCCRSPGDSVATEPTVISADQNALQDLNAPQVSPARSRRRFDPFLREPYPNTVAHDVKQDFDAPLIIQAI
jgi:hypothetical protein